MFTCYKCGVELTDMRKSVEHIIPNAIGGVWKSKNLLCKKCNKEFGNTIDTVLCKDLHPIAAFLNVDRERGSHTPIRNVRSDSGEIYHLVEGRIPVNANPIVQVDEEKKTVHIRAKDERELKLLIKQLKNKYPDLDDINIESKAKKTREYLDESLTFNMSVGGEVFNKAVLKIAVNAWLEKFDDQTTIEEPLKILKDENGSTSGIMKHYYTPDLMLSNDSNEIAHIIYLKGDPSTRLLYAYIELFSCYAYIINLNTEYLGEALEFSYHYEVLEKQTSNKKPNINYRCVLPDDLDLNRPFVSMIQEKVSRVMSIANRRQSKLQTDSLIKEAIQKAFAKFPGATHFTEEILHEVSKEISHAVAPFLVNLGNRGDGRHTILN